MTNGIPFPAQDPSEIRAHSVRQMFDSLRLAVRAADVAHGMYRQALCAGIAHEIRETSALVASRKNRRDEALLRLEAFVQELADYADVKAVHDTTAPRVPRT